MENAIKNSNELDIPNDRVQEVLELVREMFGELHHHASTGVDLHSLNISSEWAEGIKEMFNSPVKTSFEAYQNIQNSINTMIQGQFFTFLSSKQDLIDKAFLIDNNRLHYGIVLKEDTIENEANLLEFKLDYDETPVSKKFPLIISFLDLEDLEKANIETELTLG